ncbi:delta-lactam-biosynthetic de-N-acetylase [Salsuginibacillus kocurii]|uniref:delta-lactam-biosynthetic de-N-acetylase n=1 Tax=Salsuginibacillus kocurii TaxID=427078 RepID=UPI00037A6E53|nr:delta-lactam-biosynthetic de-N-acetylase [Salsuginibacillus kocurii]
MLWKAFIMIGISLFLVMFLTYDVAADPVYNWNFKPAENNEPPTTEPHYEKLLEKYGGFYKGPANEKNIYLTFDNGYENGYTEDVLDVLKEKNVPAAFFVTGHYISEEGELIQRMVDEGHTVGNHSWHHPSLPEVSDERLKRELGEIDEYYQDLTGDKEGVKYVRPPRGTFNERTLRMIEELGYTTIFWSFAYVDWNIDRQKGADYAYHQIMRRVHPGAVMLLHSVSSDNAEALERVITDLENDGYTFRSLDELAAKEDLVPFPFNWKFGIGGNLFVAAPTT